MKHIISEIHPEDAHYQDRDKWVGRTIDVCVNEPSILAAESPSQEHEHWQYVEGSMGGEGLGEFVVFGAVKLKDHQGG